MRCRRPAAQGAADVGPFYCPADHTVYLETSFFDLMEHNFGVKGKFGQAFVVAHDVGHPCGPLWARCKRYRRHST